MGAPIWKPGTCAALLWLVLGGAAETVQLVPDPALPVRFALKNGLEVVLSEDPSLPVVAVAVAYRAGSIQETEGRTGLAYLMEKLMMDAGGENVAPFQHRNTIIRSGGTLNAEAFEDRTIFYQTVPSHLLALVLWLESERMRSLVITEEVFDRTRFALLEELRQRRFVEPYLPSLYTLDRLTYADFPYSHPLLGSENDVRNLTLEDVRAFAGEAFSPGNAVLVVAGQFAAARVRDLIGRFFETIPRGKPLPPLPSGDSSWTRRRIEQSVEEPFVPAPALYIAFRILSPRYPLEVNAMTILDYVLLRGRTSRLSRRLLNRDAKIAYQLSGGLERRLDRFVYKIFVTASPTMIPACQSAVFSELEKLRRTFVSEDELSRAKARYRADLVGRTSTAADRAIYLAEEALALGLDGRTVDDLPAEQAKTFAVSAKDIVGVMNRHFTVDNSIVLILTRK
ncbi:MAG: insulinase family protein [Candidatus Aminicenantes bacterium]|nr:insulinase family protein [Candidatus Aminicenantes bacterium]